MEKYSSKKRENTIDALRAVGVLGVVLIHTGGSGMPGVLGAIAACGDRGTELLLILTAYLTFDSFERQMKAGGGKKGNLKDWYLKKALRLLPLYWIYIILFLILNGIHTTYWCGSLPRISPANILCNMFLINGLNPWHINTFLINWYLADILILYLIMPLCYRLIRSLKRAVLFSWIAIALSVMLCCVMRGSSSRFKDAYVWVAYWRTFSIFAQLPNICYGFCLFYLIKEQRLERLKSVKGAALGLGLVSLTVVVIMIRMKRSGGALDVTLWGCALFGVAVALMTSKPAWIVNNPVLLFLGKYSYGIYLSHWLIYFNLIGVYLVDKIRLDSETLSYLVIFMPVFLLSCLISVIGTELLEKPVMAFVKKDRNAPRESDVLNE